MSLESAAGQDVPATRRPLRGTVTTREIEVRRSRFIATIARADSEEEARAVITQTRATYPDARHHCSAFIVEVPGAHPIERSSDDGEPAGTAGRPILDEVRGSGLSNVVAVVTRYFGGVKLGTGGLVRAYSQATTAALEQVPQVQVERRELRTLELAHVDAGQIRAELEARHVQVVRTEYGERVTLTLATADVAELDQLVAALTSGKAQTDSAGQTEIESSYQR